MSPQDRDPYYDSVRGKPDRSEFGSLRMPMQEKRPPPSGGSGFLKVVLAVIAVVVLAVIAKRFLFA